MAKKKAFDGLYAQLEDVFNKKGKYLYTVLYSRNGDYSTIFEIENPVRQFCFNTEKYYAYTELLNNILHTLGEGYLIQKQDIFQKLHYHHETDGEDYLTECYFKHFEGREYVKIRTFLIITKKAAGGTFVKFDKKEWEDFLLKVEKVENILTDGNLKQKKMGKASIKEYVHRFMAMNFKEGSFSMTNFKCSDEFLKTGDKIIKSFSVVDIDEVNTPSFLKPFHSMKVNGEDVSTDLFAWLPDTPHAECIIYNQVIQIPQQRKLMGKLRTKEKRHDSMPDMSNRVASADIDYVLEIVEKESGLLVYSNFNIIVCCDLEKITPVTSFIETKMYECGMTPSKSAYNQLELFQNSFPGCGYYFNPNYDLFLTLGNAALCFLYKEYIGKTEDSPLKIYYTNRKGIPVGIDITGKEGEEKLTSNANFFCIGSSGTGKSFHMNSVVRQLLVQNTDVVIIDTGDSYEGNNRFFDGTYITYSKENPISMNPFKIEEREYLENFGEKKNFLKALLFLIYKGNEEPDKIEEFIINQTLIEYYQAYFNPFKGYTEEERQTLRKKLLLQDKTNGKFEEYESELEDDNDNENIREFEDLSDDDTQNKIKRKVEKLHNLVNDKSATDGEKSNAGKALMKLMPELVENKYLIRIDKKIDKMETRRKNLKVTSLSFNTYYEYAIQRIPQIMAEKSIKFEINKFSTILEPFYKGGELEDMLNRDIDKSLFEEKFIIFEIDRIKEDKILFPIVVLIIMDVFLQKMRLKRGRKALIIEEAWKAISTPTMAEYIKYLYKTVRKFNGIAGVVTQELNDVIDSPIVKDAIISNSEIKILMDQSKFKDRYDEISDVLGLTQQQRQQIFTINNLNNKENRPYFKEVWICRGQESDVFGVEEPPECYWTYTTERLEKEALKIYEKHYGSIVDAIKHIEIDRKSNGCMKYLDFAREVNKQQNVSELWKK